MKILYFDTETTGLSPEKQDIWQIAGIIEIDGLAKEEFKFECQPFSYENISQKALEIGNMSIEKLKTFMPPQEMYKKLIKIFSKYINKFDRNDKFTPSGQNVQFDIKFLNNFFLKNGDKYFGSWMEWQGVDLLNLTTILKKSGNSKYNFKNQKLETIAQFFNVDFIAHDALEDIRATRTLIKMIMKDHISVK